MNVPWRALVGLVVAAAVVLPGRSGYAAPLPPGTPNGAALASSQGAGTPAERPQVRPDGNGDSQKNENGKDGGNNGNNGDNGKNGDNGNNGNNGNNGDGWNGWNGGNDHNNSDGERGGGNDHCGQGVYCSGAPALGWPLLVIGFGGAAAIAAFRRRRGES